MNSCLYECEVMHHRSSPKVHQFSYRIFMFGLDLDEIETLAHKLKFFNHNRHGVYAFFDRDHLPFKNVSTRENLQEFLAQSGLTQSLGRVHLVTHLRTLGYLFNPVSFYFCYDENNQPLCVVPEVGNTFKEMKPFFLGPASRRSPDQFQARITKNFYVSPFTKLDSEFDFDLNFPDDQLRIQIDDYEADSRFFISTLRGQRVPLTDAKLFLFSLKYPLITLRVVFSIHLQALLLFLKKIPFLRKSRNAELQQNLFTAHKIPQYVKDLTHESTNPT